MEREDGIERKLKYFCSSGCRNKDLHFLDCLYKPDELDDPDHNSYNASRHWTRWILNHVSTLSKQSIYQYKHQTIYSNAVESIGNISSKDIVREALNRCDIMSQCQLPDIRIEYDCIL